MERRVRASAAVPAREPDSFRRLVRKEITVDEYVATLDRRIEESENGHTKNGHGEDTSAGEAEPEG